MICKKDGEYLFIRMDDGEDFYEILYKVLKKEGIFSGIVINAIGMLKDFEIGWFNMEKIEYEREKISVPHELVSTNGNVSDRDGEPFAHLHVALAGPARNIVGGHLFSAKVCNTVEMFIKKLDINLYRKEGKTFRAIDVR
ncbi:MAG: DNA-binding protein [Thermotogaceae bacterium]|nr:DNA-binding protein [Thermotogaceae bacterium]